MATLKTDYVNDVLDTSQNTERTYNIVDSEGNVLYEGVKLRETTVLSTVGDDYGALEINEQNEQINNSFATTDSASTTINDTDYIPLSTNANAKKKTLFSTLKTKLLGSTDISGIGATVTAAIHTLGARFPFSNVSNVQYFSVVSTDLGISISGYYKGFTIITTNNEWVQFAIGYFGDCKDCVAYRTKVNGTVGNWNVIKYKNVVVYDGAPTAVNQLICNIGTDIKSLIVEFHGSAEVFQNVTIDMDTAYDGKYYTFGYGSHHCQVFTTNNKTQLYSGAVSALGDYKIRVIACY